ncbi:hypothetical protein QBC39DRAFT_353043 [Podospora conica]|nr:hypothetical protein QBC39DRAFT_353043 [Schizothecium conicum]
MVQRTVDSTRLRTPVSRSGVPCASSDCAAAHFSFGSLNQNISISCSVFPLSSRSLINYYHHENQFNGTRNMTSQACQGCPNLQVYRPHPRGSSTPPNSTNQQIKTISCDQIKTIKTTSHPLTVIFAQADAIRDCTNCKNSFSDQFGIPDSWWTPWARRSNGYFGCDEQGDEQNQLKAYNTWFRFLVKPTSQDARTGKIDYHWLKWNIFTHWVAATNETFLIVFDPTDPVKAGILPIETPRQPKDLQDPYWIHAIILEQVARLQDAAVWGIRELVRTREKNRPALKAPNPDYQRDHDIARHAIHVSETAELSVKTSDHIIAMHTDFSQRHLPKPLPGEVCSHHQIDKRLWFLEHTMHSLKARSQSNRDRLINEIQLAFNVVSQYDSQTSVAIGRATQYDSYSMRTVTFLTLAFLPATFISALFSMSFFDLDDDMNWRVSGKIWMYFAIAGPVTLISLSVWFFWQKFLPPDLVTNVQLQERGVVYRTGTNVVPKVRPSFEHVKEDFPV